MSFLHHHEDTLALSIGKTDIGASSFSPLADQKRVYKTTMPAGGGLVRSLRMRLSGGAATQAYRGIVYDDSAGAPNALVAESLAYTTLISMAEHWATFPVRPYVFVPAGEVYPGFLGGPTGANSTTKFADPGGAINQWIAGDTYSDGAEATWGPTDATDTADVSIYIDYLPVAVAAVDQGYPILNAGYYPS